MTTAQPRQPHRLDGLLSPSGLFLSAIMVLALLPVTSLIRDPDFWWHLRAGQLIIANGALLGTDPFTFTVASHTWTMHEWLTEVLFAKLHEAGGLGLIVLVFSAVTWLGLLFILLRARMHVSNRFILGLGMLAAVVAGYPIWGPRAQMITFAFSALTLLLLDRYLGRGGRAIWLLVPLFLLWSNLHSGFIIGLGFIAVVLIAELAGGWLGVPDGAPRRRLRIVGLVLLACAAVSMVNPNGPAILIYAFQTQGSVAQQSLILEWHSPDFHDWVVLPFGIMMVTLLAMVVINRRMRARDAALAVVTIALALQSVRHVALFVAAATPIWIEQTSLLMARLRRRPARVRGHPPLFFRAVVWAMLVGLLGTIYLEGRLYPAMRAQEGALAYAQTYPVCAARWLAAAPGPLKIFNQYGEGGFLANRLSAHGDRVFIFGDAALMGDDLLYSYANVEGVQPNWDSTIRSSGADVVLFDTGTPLTNVMQASPRWVKVYQDPLSVAFVPADRLYQVRLAPVPTSYPAGDPCGTLMTQGLTAGAQNQ
jgi:hypothetical protein